MDSATILVLILCAGVVALLMWFEINSRRNDASKHAKSDVAETSPQKIQITLEPKVDKKKALLNFNRAKKRKGVHHGGSCHGRH